MKEKRNQTECVITLHGSESDEYRFVIPKTEILLFNKVAEILNKEYIFKRVKGKFWAEVSDVYGVKIYKIIRVNQKEFNTVYYPENTATCTFNI